MPAQTIQWWDMIGGVLKRRGYEQIPGFEPFLAGDVKPIGSADVGLVRNVGPRPGVALTRYDGDIVLTPTSVITGLDIYGQVTGRSGIVRDCIIRGPLHATTTRAMAVGTSYNFGGALFEYCRFDGTGRESEWTDCIDGGSYTARYCELTRGVDGAHCDTVGNGIVEMCRIYNGFYDSFWNDAAGTVRPGHIAQSSGDTHSDGVQLLQNAGWIIRGCYIGGARSNTTSASQLDPMVPADKVIIDARNLDNQDFNNAGIIVNTVGVKVGALIEKNWISGGAAMLNIATSASDKLDGVTVRNNRFIRQSPAYGFTIYASADHQVALSGNVYDDTGLPAAIVTH